MKYSDKLISRYSAEIASWNWERAKQNAELFPSDYHAGEYEFREFIGSVLTTYPSGKIYAEWTTNQTAKDVIRDQAFNAALENVAEKHGAYIEHSDGDLFAIWPHNDALEEYRNNDGTVEKYAHGGYPLFYISADGSCLCPSCASDPDKYCEYRPVKAEINYENSDMYCDACGDHIPAAYE